MTKIQNLLLCRMAALTLIIAVATVAASLAGAQTSGQQIQVELSTGKLIELSRPAKNVFIADPGIADIQVPSPRNIFLFGKKTGTTSLYALDEEGRPIINATVIVSYNIGGLQRLVQQEAPDSPINFTSTPSGIELSGVVPDAETAEKLRVAAARYIGDKETLVNNLKVSGAQQVNLRVRVAEVSRQITQELGFNWQSIVSPGAFSFGLATGRNAFLAGGSSLAPTNFDINGVLSRAPSPANVSAIPGSFFGNFQSSRATVNSLIDALADQGLITILAEPNLTAISGQTASFLAGGEFPIPVQQATGAAGGITIEFKQYGVSLDFVPTVLANDRISMKVRPEVSQLSTQGAITLNSITVPALTVRRAQTTIELGSGDSFAIAGLIQNNSNTDLSKFPALGDLPVLGPLFRSTNFQRNETELVIIVTPYLVRPAGANSFRAPTDGFRPATDLERIFLQRFNTDAPGTAGGSVLGAGGERLTGDAGFTID